MKHIFPLLALVSLTATSCKLNLHGSGSADRPVPLTTMHASNDPQSEAQAEAAITSVLDSFHDAAAKADGPRYFGHFAEAGVFIGTDASERWSVEQFRSFAEPYFDAKSAWTYIPIERHIDLAPTGQTAWFDERLTNAAYGQVRGSGTLVWERGEWRIAQYVLSFPVPNAVARDVVALIAATPTKQ
jgi:hypothetical protein